MSSPALRARITRLEKELTHIREKARSQLVGPKSHILVIDPRDPQLLSALSMVYNEAGITPPFANMALVAGELLRFHKATAPGNWKFQDLDGGAVEIIAPSFRSFQDWKTKNLHKFFFPEGTKDKDEIARRKSLTSGALHLGHTEDSSVSAVGLKVWARKQRQDTLDVMSKVQSYVESIITNTEVKKKVTRKGTIRVNANFSLRYEWWRDNLVKGSAEEKSLVTSVTNYLRETALGKSSKDLPDLVLDSLEDTLKTGQVKRTTNSRRSAGSKRKGPRKKEVINRYIAPSKRRAKKAVQSDSGNTEIVRGYLQSRIFEQVSKNMQYPALVYRTGRFASSVEVTSVTRNRGEFQVHYTYMKEPYGVFEPENGHPLSTPQRDPKAIIGQSLREVAQEIALVNMRLVRE